MSTTQNSRGIQALLGGLMGTFAQGSLVVRSKGATGLLPHSTFAIPLDRSEYLEQGAVFVPKNPSRTDGAWPVTSAGTEIPALAMLGGAIGNSASGTQFRFLPCPDGIEELAESGGVAGGEDFAEPGALKQLVNFKAITKANFEDFFQAQLGNYPAAALAWESTIPLDGPMVASPGPRTARSGADRMRFKHTWALFLVSNRWDAAETRRTEGDLLRDEVLATLFGRTGTRGIVISDSPGINLASAGVRQATSDSYIDVIRFETRFTLQTRIADEADAKPWLRTLIELEVPASEANPEPIVMAQPVVAMPPYGPNGPVPDEDEDEDED